MKILKIYIGGIFIILAVNSCNIKNESELLRPHQKFIDQITEKSDFFYSISEPDQLKPKKNFAVGIFDSGIGGLTVFDAIISADFFNTNHEFQSDGKEDFKDEQFLYLADQANMPYSNYVEADKKELLVEHILKDALFLLNNKYHPSSASPLIANDKPQIKAMVIACNTATAYGKSQVEELCRLVAPDMKVIGVIDAGCKGVVELIGKNENAAVGILATPATISSNAYVNNLKEMIVNYSGIIKIIQQGGKGLHESIDNKPDFINPNIQKVRNDYQGPSLQSEQYPINKELLPYYKFDTAQNRLLVDQPLLKIADTIQINSVDNYTRYHVVSLIEKLRSSSDSIPLKVIVLGCTHYPYVSENIHQIIKELRETNRYGYLLTDSVHLIDPAVNTAKELYEYLSEEHLFNDQDEIRIIESRFFMSVPNTFETDVQIGTDGRFTYQYQYVKREANENKNYTLIVPFSKDLISEEQLDIIQTRLPATYKLIQSRFYDLNNKTKND